MTHIDAGYHSSRGIYRPGLSSLERLKKTNVGKQDLFADLLKALEECAGEQPPDHTLFVGPSGIGKTHLMKLLADKLTQSRVLSNQYELVIFPVDNYRITSLELLLIEIIKILNEHVKDAFWESLLTSLENEHSDEKKQIVVKALLDHHKRSGKRFIILFENMELLFNKSQQIKEYVDDFSGFLGECGPVIFIGTACSFVTDRSLLKCKPFNYFNIIKIHELNLAQTRKLVHNHLKFDQHTELLDTFDDLSPKIQALHDLTGGNPRLILLMYDLLINENSYNIKSLFGDLLDRVTPYYYERIRSLAALDRALLSTLASEREDIHTQASLAKSLTITAQQCNAIIQRLTTLGYLDVAKHPTNKRSRVYRIKEVFFDLWLAIGQLKDPRQFLPFLSEFLQKWYSDKFSREKKRQQLWHSLKISEAGEIDRDIENTENLLRFLADIGDETERCQNYLELSYHFVMNGQKQNGRKLMKHAVRISADNPVCAWVAHKIDLLLKDAISNGYNQTIVDLFDCWRYSRVKKYETVGKLAIKISSYFDLVEEHDLNIAFLESMISILDQNSVILPLLARIASAWEKMKNFDKAISSWQKVLEMTEKSKDYKSKGTTLNNLSQVYQDKGDYSMAMEYLLKALDILQSINDYDGQSTTLNNIATVYFAQGYYEKALEFFEKTLGIIHYTNDLPLKAITLSNISFIHKERGEFKTAISNLEQSLSIMRDTRNRDGEATTLINISQLYGELGDLENCFHSVQSALHLLEELRKPQDAVQALINTGDLLHQQDALEMAMSSFLLAKKVAFEYQLDEELEKIEELTQSMEIDNTRPASITE